jgi:hypothetical protein
LDGFSAQAAVASGAARAVGGAALDGLCSRFKVESKQAVGSMFAGISLSLGADGTPVLGGSIGTDTQVISVAFDPVEQAVIYEATKHVLQHAPTLGGEVLLSGDLQLRVKVTSAVPEFEASVATLVALLAVGAIVMSLVEAWAAGGASVSGVGAGARQLILRLGPVPAL